MGTALIASLAPASFPDVATPVTTQPTAAPQCPYSLSNLRLRPGDDARLGCVINSPHAPEASNGLYACGETVYCPVSSRRASTVFNSATPIVPPATYLLSGSLTAIQDYLTDDGCSARSYRERSGFAHSGVRMHGRRFISTSQKESTMSEVGDVLAVAIEALEELLPSVTDSDLTRRIQRVMVSLERLQRELDERVH
jgi:hypothetical protein